MRNGFRTYHLAVKFYQLCRELTVAAHLRNQLDRAASSIALNLAEGAGREITKEQKRFFTIAFASLRECQAILDLEPQQTEAIKCADCLAAHTYRLIQNVR